MNDETTMYREAIVKARAIATGRTLYVSKTGFRLHYAPGEGCSTPAQGDFAHYQLRPANPSQVTCMAMCWNCERPTDKAALRVAGEAMRVIGRNVPTTHAAGVCEVGMPGTDLEDVDAPCSRPAVGESLIGFRLCEQHLQEARAN